VPPDAEKGFMKLNELWEKVKSSSLDIEFIEDKHLIDKISFIIKGKSRSFKYALLTQLLAKLIDPSVNALALQKKAQIVGAFDARSFCKETVVRFEERQLEGVLGRSKDPYVSKPLRHEIISLDILKEIKDKEGWMALHYILNTVQNRNDVDFTEGVLKQVLLEVRKYLIYIQAKRKFSIIKSPTLVELTDAVYKFLSEPSEGVRPQAVVYALMRVINKRLNVFKNIETAKATVADKSAGRLADIECKDESGTVKVGISVTEVLDANKLREELDKSVQNRVRKMILLAREIRHDSHFYEVMNYYMRSYNLDVIVGNIVSFTSVFVTLLNDNMREEFIREVANILNELGYQNHLVDWINILRDMEIVEIVDETAGMEAT
jgi:hypothetical protein